MDLKQTRGESLKAAQKLGYKVADTLPLLEQGMTLRSKEDAVSRLLTLYVIVACGYGFERQKGQEWLRRENLSSFLTPSEKRWLAGGPGSAQQFQAQVEGLWALGWALHFIDDLDFGRQCSDSFVAIFPNVKQNQNSQEFRARAALRAVEEVITACDLAYCLHWAIRQSQLEGKKPPGNVPPQVIIERRRALEWLLSSEDWDDVSMDT